MVLPPIADDVFKYARRSEELVKERGLTRSEADDLIRRENELVWLRFRGVLNAHLRATGSRF